MALRAAMHASQLSRPANGLSASPKNSLDLTALLTYVTHGMLGFFFFKLGQNKLTRKYYQFSGRFSRANISQSSKEKFVKKIRYENDLVPLSDVDSYLKKLLKIIFIPK